MTSLLRAGRGGSRGRGRSLASAPGTDEDVLAGEGLIPVAKGSQAWTGLYPVRLIPGIDEERSQLLERTLLAFQVSRLDLDDESGSGLLEQARGAAQRTDLRTLDVELHQAHPLAGK